MSKPKTLVDIRKVTKSFKNPDGQDLVVMNDVDITINEGEIVALLGKSGSGKSTLLRIIAGLSAPTHGEVIYQNKPVNSPVPGISMVFQSFALMPWLTVLQNVELGLEAQKMPADERRERALKAINTIGLDGFENAYPKELSGGMRQRVGFARALVVEPDLLLMDEPFSALDVLTADNLRSDLMELWHKGSKMKGILFVTHNIEEAVLIADRILIFGSNPGCIHGEIKVNLPHPRLSNDQPVLDLIDDVYTLMTTSHAKAIKTKMEKRIGLDYRLPDVEVSEMIGLLEQLDELQTEKAIDLPDLADEIRLDVDDLFPILEVLSLLGLAKISEGDISISQLGRNLAHADMAEQKVIFSNLLLKYIPLARHILKVLHERPNHKAHESRFLAELEDYFTEDEAYKILEALIDWARYAELFHYDYHSKTLSLDL